MSNIDKKLKAIFIGGVLWLLLISFCVLLFQFYVENKQAQRELEYLKAHQRVEAAKKERFQEWERRLKQNQMQQEYRQNYINGQTANQ